MTDSEREQIKYAAKGFCTVRAVANNYSVYFAEGIAKTFKTSIVNNKGCEIKAEINFTKNAIIVTPHSQYGGINCTVYKYTNKLLIVFAADNQAVYPDFDLVIF